ncbi:MAG TPA: glycosyltransferase family 87 protein [Chloroflexota bacterium]
MSPELERAVVNVVLAVLPMAFTAFLLLGALRAHVIAQDFHESYYPAARRLIDGANPYVATASQIKHGMAFTYPPFAVVLFAPFALLGRSRSDHVYMLLCLLAVPASVWAVGVRDWRAYGLPLLWLPVIVGWQGGNVSLPILFLVALAWRWRDWPLRAGLVVAVAISLKTFAWPLGLWLLATRRWRAGICALASGTAINLAAWAIVGFNRIESFLRVSGQLIDGQWRTGYSMLAVASHLGLTRGVGELLLLGGSAAVALALLHQGFIRGRERGAMVLTVALMLIASPVVWSHYFVLLLVPIALARPRVSRLWLLPVAIWVCPVTTPSGWQLALAWAVAGGCLALALRKRPVGRRLADRRPYESRPAEVVVAS